MLDEPTAITMHLYERPPVNGVQYKSSLIALLTDARGAAERDLGTGQVLAGRPSSSWLAAAGYLILLDQIGTCFKLRGPNVRGDHPILWALLYFSQVQDSPTLDALYALRNALAHDYALFNLNTKHASRQHAFNYSVEPSVPLVQLPITPWTGVYDPSTLIPADQITTVNLRKVGDLTEEVVASLRANHAAGNLTIRPPLSVAEFHMRYGMAWRMSNPVSYR
jgi:hypothetical protein